MNKPTLANLYRQATRDDATVPDADKLIALAQGERPADAERIVAEIAQSALQSDLLHFARALEPESSALSAELSAAFDERSAYAHARTQAAPARVAAGRWRNLRRAGVSVAAALMVAVAMWTQHKPAPAPLAKAAAPAADRIFAALDDRNIANNRSDEIFNGSFKSDVIFRAD
jgi:hypothetical protein